MSIPTTKLEVQIEFTAFEENSDRVLVRQFREGGKPHFQVRIFLAGPDIHKVSRVVYTLHPTFPTPRREVTDGRNFELRIWAWGVFEMSVDIYDNQGKVDHRTVYLDYAGDIKTAQANSKLFWAK